MFSLTYFNSERTLSHAHTSLFTVSGCHRYDTMGTGYIEAETFFTVMKSPDLALPLDEDELLILTSNYCYYIHHYTHRCLSFSKINPLHLLEFHFQVKLMTMDGYH